MIWSLSTSSALSSATLLLKLCAPAKLNFFQFLESGFFLSHLCINYTVFIAAILVPPTVPGIE